MLSFSNGNLIFREIGKDNKDFQVIFYLFLMIFFIIGMKIYNRWIIGENFGVIEDVIILREGEEEENRKQVFDIVVYIEVEI